MTNRRRRSGRRRRCTASYLASLLLALLTFGFGYWLGLSSERRRLEPVLHRAADSLVTCALRQFDPCVDLDDLEERSTR